MATHCSLCERIELSTDPMVLKRTDHSLLYHMPGIDLPGYLVVAPLRHVEHVGMLDDAELFDLACLQAKATREIMEVHSIQRVYTLSFGEMLPHLHIHLFPRTEKMLDDPESLHEGIADGPKLFDRWRKRLAISLPSPKVAEMVDRMRQRLL